MTQMVQIVCSERLKMGERSKKCETCDLELENCEIEIPMKTLLDNIGRVPTEGG